MNIYGAVKCTCGAKACKDQIWFVKLIRKDENLYWEEIGRRNIDVPLEDIPLLGSADLSKWTNKHMPYEELPLEVMELSEKDLDCR